MSRRRPGHRQLTLESPMPPCGIALRTTQPEKSSNGRSVAPDHRAPRPRLRRRKPAGRARHRRRKPAR
eukprot:5535673-Lingulodinium_polyedra.AAC.1